MVNVIGLGYIGLPTALMMASHGVEVVGTNHSQGKVDMLKAGKTTFKEEGLDELFQAALDGGIKFTTEYQVADVYIVSVQTPYDKFTKKVEMKYVTAAIGDVLKVAPKGAIIVVESTVSPGSIDKYVCFFLWRKHRCHRHQDGRDDEGRREYLPRCQHSFCQRAGQDLPPRQHGCV